MIKNPFDWDNDEYLVKRPDRTIWIVGLSFLVGLAIVFGIIELVEYQIL